MQRLLITGGSGFLGSELVRQARIGAWEVAATYHRQPFALSGVVAYPLQLHDEHALHDLFALTRPDVVIHTAYVQRGPELWETTAKGAGRVARLAQQYGARLIHLSSDALFDGERMDAYTEADLPSPITDYGCAKAEAECLVAQLCPSALIVRTSLLYGYPNVPISVHEQLVFDVLDGRQDMTFFTDEIRCPIQVGDLAGALLELAGTDCTGILNLAGSDSVSRYAFAQLIAQSHQRPVESLRAGLSAESGVRRPQHCVLDSSLARSLLKTRLRGVYEVFLT